MIRRGRGVGRGLWWQADPNWSSACPLSSAYSSSQGSTRGPKICLIADQDKLHDSETYFRNRRFHKIHLIKFIFSPHVLVCISVVWFWFQHIRSDFCRPTEMSRCHQCLVSIFIFKSWQDKLQFNTLAVLGAIIRMMPFSPLDTISHRYIIYAIFWQVFNNTLGCSY